MRALKQTHRLPHVKVNSVPPSRALRLHYTVLYFHIRRSADQLGSQNLSWILEIKIINEVQ